MKTKPTRILVVLLTVILLTGCHKKEIFQSKQVSVFAKGVDISWLPQMD